MEHPAFPIGEDAVYGWTLARVRVLFTHGQDLNNKRFRPLAHCFKIFSHFRGMIMLGKLFNQQGHDLSGPGFIIQSFIENFSYKKVNFCNQSVLWMHFGKMNAGIVGILGFTALRQKLCNLKQGFGIRRKAGVCPIHSLYTS